MGFAFNEDGSLAVAKKKQRDHLQLLKAIEELPFSMGKKLLCEHLRGKRNAKTAKLRLDKYMTFGELGGYEEEEIQKLIDYLEAKNYLQLYREKGLYPVYKLTEKGEEELQTPQAAININELDKALEEHIQLQNPFTTETKITEQDKQLFKALNGFFDHFNEQQKKAAICQANKILCVAGAGSGKTSVLTKRIQFLTQYRSIEPQKILAITFTKKARTEMQNRLEKILPGKTINVETFNSHCEKELQNKGNKHYNKPVRMASRKEQVELLLHVLKKKGYNQQSMIETYFTKRQQAGKDRKRLFFTFAYDFQSLLDKIRITDNNPQHLKGLIKTNRQHAPLAHDLLEMANNYLQLMKEQGLRDYTDQLLHTIEMYEQNEKLIPRYEHVLVDEYQDVNDQQVKLLKLLNPPNLFAVGDPRQSIYGWRGSRMSHIIDFAKDHEEAEIIQLTTNYRSTEEILKVCNQTIKSTGYPDLKSAISVQNAAGISGQSSAVEVQESARSTQKVKPSVQINYHKNEEGQTAYIANQLQKRKEPLSEVFILARTNKTLENMRTALETKRIKYLLRTEEKQQQHINPDENQVTLATIHAIKGLESKEVHIVNANSTNFPCKANDHPVMELFNLNEDYDSYAEELRVLYVALSRAQEKLHIHYTGKLSPFLNGVQGTVVSDLQGLQRDSRDLGNRTLSRSKTQKTVIGTETAALMMQLRQWRYQKAKERGCPAYIICSDKTLQAVAENKPQNVEDLYVLPGLGPARIQDYGEELIEHLQTI